MIRLNYRDSRPIYEQVMDGLRQLIINGVLPENSKLPSVRELAVSLAINPNTIQRAYRGLEAEGYIISVPGKGSFATHSEPDPWRKDELLRQFDEITQELLWMGMTALELKDRIGGA